ncbi:thioester reductase domain-containing protein [Nocardia asteroides]|uniref:thioester reductase domain-containing protein n=1 Tax=Nocardia asteroides TaxID=1824 RepID=UPI0037CA7177
MRDQPDTDGAQAADHEPTPLSAVDRRSRAESIERGDADLDVAALLARVGRPIASEPVSSEAPTLGESRGTSKDVTALLARIGVDSSRKTFQSDELAVQDQDLDPAGPERDSAADRGSIASPRSIGSDPRRPADAAELAGAIAAVASRFTNSPVTEDVDFFDAGGTSIAAVEFVAALAGDLDIHLDLDTVFFDARPRRLARRWLTDHPDYAERQDTPGRTGTAEPATVQSTDTVDSSAVGRRDAIVRARDESADAVATTSTPESTDTDDLALLFADLAGADRLPVVAATPRTPPRRILLTGATGFLGSHLLLDLLRNSDAHVVCLVRAADDTTAARRLEQALRQYALPWSREVLRRVTPLAGDLREPRLGLTGDRWDSLAAEIDSIVNAGAAVDFLRGYPSLRRTNVHGPLTLAELACTNRLKPVHHISSLAVFNGSEAATLAEDAPTANVADLPIGYDRSKWAAEAVLRRAGEHGLTVTVLRPGGIGGHPETGAHNPRDLNTGISAALLRFRTVPGFRYLNAAPVDWVSRTAAEIVLEPSAWGQTYHLTGPATSLDQILAETTVGGLGVRVQHWEHWAEEVVEAIRSEQATELEPLAQVLRSPVARRQLAAMVDTAPATATRTESFVAARGLPAPNTSGSGRARMLAALPTPPGEHPYLRFHETLAGTVTRTGETTEFACDLRLTLSVANSAQIFAARTLQVGGVLICPALHDEPLAVEGTAIVRPHDGTPLPDDLRHPIMHYQLTLRDSAGQSWWLTGYKFAAARRRFVRQLGTQVVEIGRIGEPATYAGEVSVPMHTYLPDQIDGIEIDPALPERQRRLAKMLWLSWFGGQLGKSLVEPMLRVGLDLLDLRRALRKDRR